jgi:hypothetical protein
MSSTPRWHFGNAAVDSAERRGWLVGPFMDADDLHRSNQLEIQWGVHPAGDRREAWFEEETRTTVLMLISGRFQ